METNYENIKGVLDQQDEMLSDATSHPGYLSECCGARVVAGRCKDCLEPV